MKKIFMLIILLTSIMFGQTYNPYATDGWDVPYSFTGQDSLAKPPGGINNGYYGFGIFRLGSNPGGWLNYNFWKTDSLMEALVVYTDTSQFVIENDTLKLAPALAAALDTSINTEFITFSPTEIANVPHKEARIFFDSTTHAFTYYVTEEDIAMQIGQEIWLILYNDTGLDIPNGTPVRSGSGAVNGWGTMALADASDDSTSAVIGITTHTIENNSLGFITRIGSTSDISTIGLSAGVVYLSEIPGEKTSDKPSAPANAVPLGAIIIPNSANGAMYTVIERFNTTNGIAHVGFKDSSVTQGITTIDVPVRITNSTNTLYQYNTSIGHDVYDSGDTLYFAEDGVYLFNISYSFQGVSSAIFKFELKLDGDFVPNAAAYRKTSTADVGNCGFTAMVDIESTEVITMWITNTGNGGDCTMVGSTITVIQVR